MKPAIKGFSLFATLIIFFHAKVFAAPPANDACSTPTVLNSGAACSNTAGTLLSATATAGLAACGNASSADVWYIFTAYSQYPTITLSSLGANFNTAGPRIQVFSGSCGSLTQVVCSSTLATTLSTPLAIGTQYYVRITTNTNTGSPASGAWGFNICITNPVTQVLGNNLTKEVFKQTTLVPQSSGLNDPWEITYGSDGFLWITVAKDYKILRMDPANGNATTVLDISPTATGYLTATEHTNYNRLSWTTTSQIPWPQGGLMGLALHPEFSTNPAKRFVYTGYVRAQGSVPTDNTGQYYTNFLVRFTYNPVSGHLENPVTLCDTLPGSKDHNSGRLIIAPVNGVNYLFYSSGDMGAGQFENLTRPINAQKIQSYEGKILRFNLEEDGDAVQNVGVRSVNYNRWIPNGTGPAANPYNTYLGVQSAVWNMGHRNVQGFAKANIGGTDFLYASSHGPFSDDELNIMTAGKNYGHPLVVGYSTDGNYNQAKAGPVGGSLPLLSSTGEADNVTAINALPYGTGYQDPIFSFYPVPKGSTSTCSTPGQNSPFIASICNVQDVYRNCGGTSNNNFWKSEAPSGLDIYTSKTIPGWSNSLLMTSLKWGRIVKLKLNTAGTAITPTSGVDTVPFFSSQNRYRDLAISPDGKDIFIIMDKSTSTSGPSQANPSTLNCTGCVIKYSFMGYNDNGGASSIPTTMNIAPGINNQLTNATPTAISTTTGNTEFWVPVTDSVGNIIAEIDANGNNLGNITSTLFKNSTGTVRRTDGGTAYLDRSITINVQNPPSTNVNVRLYLKASELAALVAAPSSGVADINTLFVYKNNDLNGTQLKALPLQIAPARGTFGSDYVLTISINSFSTFYFAGAGFVLPLDLLSITGNYKNGSAQLQWKTANERNTSKFIVERSINGQDFKPVGTVAARGNTTSTSYYTFEDKDIVNESSPNIYYRLRMVDIDNVYKYSNIISIALPVTKGAITISPNPAVDKLTSKVFAPVAGNAIWQILDNAGRIVMSGNETLKKGNNEFYINLDKLAPGLYYFKISGTSVDCKTKFLKL